MLPPELLRGCQLFSGVTSKVKEISNVPFEKISINNQSLSDSLSQKTELSSVRLSNGKVIEKLVNKRIFELRKKQERELLEMVAI